MSSTIDILKGSCSKKKAMGGVIGANKMSQVPKYKTGGLNTKGEKEVDVMHKGVPKLAIGGIGKMRKGYPNTLK